jgi:hypothetical protein
MITFGSVPGAMVYWAMLTGIGLMLSGAALVELRRRGVRIGPWHRGAALVTILGFAALGYAGVGRAFYTLEKTDAGLALTYHWPERRILVPWDSVRAVNTAPGYKGQRPLRVAARNGRDHLSAMIPVSEAIRLSRCLDADAARRRAREAAGAPAAGCP